MLTCASRWRSTARRSLPTITDLWPAANWYEREVWDMFGIVFDGHPHLRGFSCRRPGWAIRCARIIRRAPPRWARFSCPNEQRGAEEEALRFEPEDWGMARAATDDDDFMFLNLGPQHPGTHGVLRIVLQLRRRGDRRRVPDIGYHHRGAEKMGERQSWHTYIPYTDRVDYLGGVMNNLPVPARRRDSWPASRCRIA